MARKERTYEGRDIEVRYDVGRCIHAAECVRGLRDVFDPDRRPWVAPDAAPADTVADVIHRCPTGALHYARTDGGPAEPVPEANTITVRPNGPLYVRGDVEVITPDGDVIRRDTRLALCRCGDSRNKPFCDNSHVKKGFRDAGTMGDVRVKPPRDDADGTLRVRPSRNGPLLIQGPLTIRGRGQDPAHGSQATLCRCGGSSNKPFCDGTHGTNGFTDEA